VAGSNPVIHRKMLSVLKVVKSLIGILLALLFLSVHAYDREDYPHWIDLDNDGQNTREKILIRDSLVDVTFRADGKVDSGLWVCLPPQRVGGTDIWIQNVASDQPRSLQALSRL